MKHIAYDPDKSKFSIAILIKENNFNQQMIDKYYVDPLVAKGVDRSEIIILSLGGYQKTIKVTDAKPHLDIIAKALAQIEAKHVLVADGKYFKIITKVGKIEKYYGEIIQGKYPGYENLNIALTGNYAGIYYNEALAEKITFSLRTFAFFIEHGNSLFSNHSVIKSFHVPQTLEDIKKSLKVISKHPALTCDIETFSLRFIDAGLGTICFAWDRHNGMGFDVSHTRNLQTEEIKELLKEFFIGYKGDLWFHNALFDVKILIWVLFMKEQFNIDALHQGLDVFKNVHDTQIITYLAINSTGQTKLGLKANSYEFTGNYALDDDEIVDIRKVDLPKLLDYNVIDCMATWYVHDKYMPIVIADDQLEVYNNLFQPSLNVLLKMMLVGIPIDLAQVANVKEQLVKLMDGYLSTIRRSPLINDLTFDLQLIETQKANAKLKKKIKSVTEFSHIQFNPGSDKQVQYLLYNFIGLEPIDFTNGGAPAVGKGTLKKLLDRLVHEHGITDSELT